MNPENAQRLWCFLEAIQDDDVEKAESYLKYIPFVINKWDYVSRSTPLTLAALYCRNDTKMMEMLCRHKADVNVKSPEDTSPLWGAIICRNRLAFDFLIEHGVDVNMRYADKVPLVFMAAFFDVYMLEKMIEKGADIKGVNKNKDTILHYAVNGRNLDSVKLLMKTEAARYALQKNCVTVYPLMSAISRGTAEIVQTLLDGNEQYKPNLLGAVGEELIKTARVEGKEDIVKLLEKTCDMQRRISEENAYERFKEKWERLMHRERE